MSNQVTGKSRLIALYKRMAQMTNRECRYTCRVPLSCCAPEYCEMAKDEMKKWGEAVAETGHPKLPFMGPDGCVVPPHLRPICTFHTCEMNSLGCKKGNARWTERYFRLRERIVNLRLKLLPW